MKEEDKEMIKNTKEEKVRKEVVIKKLKRKLTDKSTEKPLIYGIGGCCYKNYLHKPLG